MGCIVAQLALDAAEVAQPALSSAQAAPHVVSALEELVMDSTVRAALLRRVGSKVRNDAPTSNPTPTSEKAAPPTDRAQVIAATEAKVDLMIRRLRQEIALERTNESA